MTDSNYNHGKHRKGMLLVHVVFVTKYRRTCLVDEYADTCKQVLRDSAQKLGIEVKEIEIDKNHVHMLIDYPPTVAISTIVMLAPGEKGHFGPGEKGHFPVR